MSLKCIAVRKMPYNNAYNQSIAAQNQNLYKKKIAY